MSNVKYTHLLVMGDFNLTQIDLQKYQVNDTDGSPAQIFFDTTQELYLLQCVKFNTWVRYNNQASLLDLVITNEEDMVTEMKGKSDHVGVIWKFVVETEVSSVDSKKCDYWIGDYPGLNEYLRSFDWEVEFTDFVTDLFVCKEFN